LGLIHWGAYTDKELRSLVKKLYELKGYDVEDVHGRLEPGIDLIAKKFDFPHGQVIEKLGIQVTKSKADKSRVENASFALHQEDLSLLYFLTVAIQGPTEDFNFHLNKIDKKDKVFLIDGEMLEKELLTKMIPDQELQRLEEEFYKSKAFTILKEISNCIYEKGFLSKLSSLESALDEIRENRISIMENLRLSMRGLEATSIDSQRIYLSMLKASSDRRFDVFLQTLIKGEASILSSLTKIREALMNLADKPVVIKLIWESLSATERAGLRIPNLDHKTKIFWLFRGFDPELILSHGAQIVLIHIFFGLSDTANILKNRIEKVIRFLEDEDSTKAILKRSITSN